MSSLQAIVREGARQRLGRALPHHPHELFAAAGAVHVGAHVAENERHLVRLLCGDARGAFGVAVRMKRRLRLRGRAKPAHGRPRLCHLQRQNVVRVAGLGVAKQTSDVRFGVEIELDVACVGGPFIGKGNLRRARCRRDAGGDHRRPALADGHALDEGLSRRHVSLRNSVDEILEPLRVELRPERALSRGASRDRKRCRSRQRVPGALRRWRWRVARRRR
mmetsp:Transcript_5133/g.14583  ORF Transcript_5133/g.14583 Transcript_5133/m.14583 type:complete len:220 (-) Transcript_5133:2100-2759(-)